VVLITLEGIDGSGKSTLLSALEKSLSDLSPVFTREPGATWVGEQVRRAITERADPVTEALLFAADHAAHLEAVVTPGPRRRGGLSSPIVIPTAATRTSPPRSKESSQIHLDG